MKDLQPHLITWFMLKGNQTQCLLEMLHTTNCLSSGLVSTKLTPPYYAIVALCRFTTSSMPDHITVLRYRGTSSITADMGPLVTAWRNSNPNIVKFWWAVDRAVMKAIIDRTTTETHGLTFTCRSGMLFITLPSGRKLAYVKPRIGMNQCGGESVTYEGIGATKKWDRIESYGPKFVENIVQAISRDILCYAMKTLRHCSIVMHIHDELDELVIEANPRMSLDAVCEQMGRTPPWADGLILEAAGYVTEFYKKD